MNSRSHKLGVLLTIILIIAAFFLSFKKYLISSTSGPVVPVTTPGPSPTIKYIRSLTYGFSFAVPNDWIQEEWDLKKVADLSSVPDGSIAYQFKAYKEPYKFEILIWENRSRLGASSWIKNYLHEEIDRSVVPTDFNAIISNTEAIRIDQISKARNKSLTYLFLEKDGKIYELIFENNNNVQFPPVYQEIIDSFAFIETDSQS